MVFLLKIRFLGLQGVPMHLGKVYVRMAKMKPSTHTSRYDVRGFLAMTPTESLFPLDSDVADGVDTATRVVKWCSKKLPAVF